jgi:broad specificity phosphatase PhoE
MDIFLVRHGEAAASWGESPDPGLSDLGRREAEQAAETLRPLLCDDARLFSSTLLRAIETAAPLAVRLQRPLQQSEVYREVPSPVPLAERQTWLRQFMQEQWQEQSAQLHAWRSAALQELLELDRPAVIFTHFLVINAVVGQVLERPETLCFWPANGSVTQFHHNGTGLELVALGKELETVVN